MILWLGPQGHVCVCLLFLFYLLHPRSGICQLRTNGGIWWGKTRQSARQYCYQHQGWLSFRGHTHRTLPQPKAMWLTQKAFNIISEVLYSLKYNFVSLFISQHGGPDKHIDISGM